jgi:hypothetical protein
MTGVRNRTGDRGSQDGSKGLDVEEQRTEDKRTEERKTESEYKGLYLKRKEKWLGVVCEVDGNGGLYKKGMGYGRDACQGKGYREGSTTSLNPLPYV